jgi:hypothetical protein
LLGREDTVAVGIRAEGALVGYSLCYRIRETPYPGVSFLSALDPARSVVYHGGGTVIVPRYEGRLLSRRLFLARRDELRRRGSQHFVGLIAVGNWLSLGNAVHAGGVLVGLATDETSLNYVAYAGELLKGRSTSPEVAIDWTDVNEHERMFAAGRIVVGMDGTGRTTDARSAAAASANALRKLRRFVFSRIDPVPHEVSA